MADNASTSLDRTLVQGIAWTGAIRWTVQTISWCATFVIARLLSPTDYGLVGMAMIYVGLAQIVTEGGLSYAIVQQRDLTKDQISQLNGFAVMIGVVLFALTLGLAEPISWFFGEPQVERVISVVSIIFLIRSVQVVPRALMARELAFRRLAWIDGLETFTLMVTTLLLALAHMGFWSLCLGALVSGVFTSALSLWWRSHPMSFPRTIDPIRRPVTFAWQVVTSQIAWYTYSNADFAVVGRVLGKAALGAYSFAWTIASVPVDRVSSLVSRVTPAFFAAVQHDPPALRRYLLNLTDGLALVTLPACIGLSIVAPEFVVVVLGNAWTPAIMPLRLLSLYAAFRSVITPAPTILVATGHAKKSMYFSLISAVVLPVAFYIGSRWGTTGVAMGWFLVYPVLAIGLFLRSAFRAIGMTAREYVRALAPAMKATLVMALVLLLLRRGLPETWMPLLRLICQVVVGAAVYSAIIYFRHRERLRAITSLIQSSGGGRKQPETPVFDSGGPAAADRLLLITYHFPPDTAVGALRWRKLARHAAERGWGLDVITADPAGLASKDPSGLEDLPRGVRVYGVAAKVPALERLIDRAWFAWRGFKRPGHTSPIGAATPVKARRESLSRAEMRWLPRERRDLARAYFAATEHARYGRWAKDAACLALKIHDPKHHRAVITSGPPHPAHEAGVLVAQQTGLPLVLDLRDPWSLVQRLPEAIASPVRLFLSSRAERRAIRQAGLIVTNTPPLRDAMRARYPHARDRIIAVPNGFDDDPVPPPAPSGRCFTVAYAGSIYLDRDPRWLFRGVARVASELNLTPADLCIELMGNVASFDGVPIEAMAREEGVTTMLKIHAPGSRAQALEFQARATMLVVLPQDSDMAIPAKVFDYARFNAWILAFAAPGSATAMILEGTSATVVSPGDLDGLCEVLRKRYLQHLRGEQAVPLTMEARLSRRAQANVLFTALEEIAGVPRPSSPAPEAPTPQLSGAPA